MSALSLVASDQPTDSRVLDHKICVAHSGEDFCCFASAKSAMEIFLVMMLLSNSVGLNDSWLALFA